MRGSEGRRGKERKGGRGGSVDIPSLCPKPQVGISARVFCMSRDVGLECGVRQSAPHRPRPTQSTSAHARPAAQPKRWHAGRLDRVATSLWCCGTHPCRRKHVEVEVSVAADGDKGTRRTKDDRRRNRSWRSWRSWRVERSSRRNWGQLSCSRDDEDDEDDERSEVLMMIMIHDSLLQSSSS